MKRLDLGHLLELGDDLTLKERSLIETVAKFGLMSHAQLAAYLRPFEREASEASRARTTRRTLSQLTALALLARFDRRVGGVRAGSSGYLYYLGPAGQRLLAYWQGQGLTRGRFRPDPGSRYVKHRLAVAELFIELWQVNSQGGLDLLAFDPEPACWRSFSDGLGGERLLKPDAHVRVGLGAYEDRYFVEVDLGTESTEVVLRKLRLYLSYFRTGTEQAGHGVFPRVLVLTNTEQRKAALLETCQRLPAEAWQLFVITTLDRALEVMRGQYLDHEAAEQETLS
jgi:hypothetical protein